MKLSVREYSGFKVYFVLLDALKSITRGSVSTSVAEGHKGGTCQQYYAHKQGK